MNGKRSLRVAERRVRTHLVPFFAGRRLATLTTADIRAYIAHRRAQGVIHPRTGQRLRDVSPAEINRELALLKRMYSLARQAGLLLHRPHIPLLAEHNVRTGFFEAEQLEAVLRHLPPAVQPVIRFAAITGWRIPSEVLPLQWRQVDFAAGEVRLEPGTAKNRAARVFPFTAGLRAILEAQWAEHERLAREGRIVPWVFHRNGRPIRSFVKAWRIATRAAGCPGRIPHDLRCSAVRAMVRAGIPERVAMALTGQKTRSIFDRHHIVSPTDLRLAAERLDGHRPTAGARTERP